MYSGVRMRTCLCYFMTYLLPFAYIVIETLKSTNRTETVFFIFWCVKNVQRDD